MIIGKFQKEEKAFVGNILGLNAPAPVCITSTDLKGIDYTVTAYGLDLGVAWQKKSAKGNDYLSIKLDNPFLAAPVNCALVKQSDGYALIWDRKPTKPDSAEENADE
jgi:uncharacterized protein (DUF736 family)